jgi:hypothetical protein
MPRLTDTGELRALGEQLEDDVRAMIKDTDPLMMRYATQEAGA